MAGLAGPALEAAFLALLGAVGVGVAGDILRRQRAVSEAGASPAAKAAPQTRNKACEKCPPECGLLVSRHWDMSAASREYQARVTGFAPFTEWNFATIDFDGFSSADCTLREAKARFDQFLIDDDQAGVRPKRWFTAFEDKMLPQARSQAIVASASPPARLSWYFQGQRTYQYMAKQVRQFPPLVAFYLP
jgi:hypothetical protein